VIRTYVAEKISSENFSATYFILRFVDPHRLGVSPSRFFISVNLDIMGIKCNLNLALFLGCRGAAVLRPVLCGDKAMSTPSAAKKVSSFSARHRTLGKIVMAAFLEANPLAMPTAFPVPKTTKAFYCPYASRFIARLCDVNKEVVPGLCMEHLVEVARRSFSINQITTLSSVLPLERIAQTVARGIYMQSDDMKEDLSDILDNERLCLSRELSEWCSRQ